MEAITLQNGVIEAPHVEQMSTCDQSPTDTALAAGNIAPASEFTGPAVTARRYGYREDSPPETIDLLHRSQAGDREAFAELYRTHVDQVTRYVTARMRDRNRDVIPDLVQDAFCEALAELPSAHNDVKGWFLAHAAKACTRHDWSTRRYVRAAKTVQEQTKIVETLDPASATETPATIGRVTLVHALARLVPDQRRAIQLRFLDGYPRDQRADLLAKTPNGMKYLEAQALRQLRIQFLAVQELDPSLGSIAQ